MSLLKRFRFFLALIVCLALLLIGAGIQLRWMALLDRLRGLGAAAHRDRVYAWSLRWADRLMNVFGDIVDFGIAYRLPLRRDPPPPAIVVVNHRSTFDLLIVYAALWRMGYRKVRSVAKAETVKVPVIGRTAREIGSAFVSRTRDPADLERVRRCALGAAEDGACVLIFPEGTTYGDAVFLTRSDVDFHNVLPPRFGGVRALCQTLPDYPVLSLTVDWLDIQGAYSTARLYALVGKKMIVEAEYLDGIAGRPVERWLTEDWLRKDRRLTRT